MAAEVPGEVTALNWFVLKVENPLPEPGAMRHCGGGGGKILTAI